MEIKKRPSRSDGKPDFPIEEVMQSLVNVLQRLTHDHQQWLKRYDNPPRTRYDRLAERGLLDARRLITEWDAVFQKKSKLPSAVRTDITAIVDTALHDLITKKAQAQQVRWKPKAQPAPK